MKLRTLLLLVIPAYFAGCGVTAGGFVAYAQIADARTKDPMPIAYTELLQEIEGGHVEEIRVHGRECTITLVVDKGTMKKRTIGPMEGLEAIKPRDPTIKPPRITR